MKRKEAIEVIDNLGHEVEAVVTHVTLVNQATGETLNPDGVAIKAGVLAGLAAARFVLEDMPSKDYEIDCRTFVSEIMTNASRAYFSMVADVESEGGEDA